MINEFQKMREIGLLTTQCLDDMPLYIIKESVTGDVIDQWIKEWAEKHNVVSAQKGYNGFPGYCCLSKNEVICHGVPTKHVVLNYGDIVTVDITFISKDGYHGDAARTFIIGKTNDKVQHLIDVAKEATQIGIKVAVPGNKMNDIGAAIQNYIKAQRMSVVDEFVGHGIGKEFHAWPVVPHTLLNPEIGDVPIVPGMMFTIEPIICLGRPRNRTEQDQWTVTTKDKSWCAQFESTIGITDKGNEIFAS